MSELMFTFTFSVPWKFALQDLHVYFINNCINSNSFDIQLQCLSFFKVQQQQSAYLITSSVNYFFINLLFLFCVQMFHEHCFSLSRLLLKRCIFVWFHVKWVFAKKVSYSWGYCIFLFYFQQVREMTIKHLFAVELDSTTTTIM